MIISEVLIRIVTTSVGAFIGVFMGVWFLEWRRKRIMSDIQNLSGDCHKLATDIKERLKRNLEEAKRKERLK